MAASGTREVDHHVGVALADDGQRHADLADARNEPRIVPQA